MAKTWLTAAIIALGLGRAAAAPRDSTLLRTLPPLQQDSPVYRRTVKISPFESRLQHFLNTRSFFAGYFQRATPEFELFDWEAGHIVAQVNLFYTFPNERGIMVQGRAVCRTEVQIGDSTARLLVSQIRLLHRTHHSRTVESEYMIVDSEWKGVNQERLFRSVREQQAWGYPELSALHRKVADMLESLELNIDEPTAAD